MSELYEVTKILADVAMGRRPAELVIKNTTLVNVCTAELLNNTDIAVVCGRIALVGDASHCVGDGTRVYDAKGAYAAPGFIDSHLHVESSMLTVKEFAKSVVPLGTTTVLMDPHEIANVFGTEGVELMLEDGKDTPLRVYSTAPSCVPACGAFEAVPYPLERSDIAKMMEKPMVGGLGEMMNYPGVIFGDEEIHGILSDTLKSKKPLTGHWPAPVGDGKGINAYIASGINSDHETVNAEDALYKMRLGMYTQIREGSAWHDVEATIKSVAENDIDTRFCVLCTDDTHPDTLLTLGHMNYVVIRAIEEGVPPIKAIQMATINAADCIQKPDLGVIAPSKIADIQLFDDIQKPVAKAVFTNGELVAENGMVTTKVNTTVYPDYVCNSIKIPRDLKAEDFVIKCDLESAKVKVMGVGAGRVATEAMTFVMLPQNGELKSDTKRDILKVAVIERHSNKGEMSVAFVNGFGFSCGAVAQTVSHDAHNLLVTGTNDADMALAANALKNCGGGMCVVKDGEVIALLPLPVAGLMSDKNAEETAALVADIGEGYRKIGCLLPSPFMTMALIGLAVIPELRLTYKGLVDVVNFEFTALFD